VAFTRAQSELYIVGVRRRQGYPFDLLEPYTNVSLGRVCRPDKTSPSRSPWTAAVHRRGTPARVPGGETFPTSLLGVEERERGEIIHHALAAIDFVDGDTPRRVDEALRRWGGESALNWRDPVLAALSSPRLLPYFLPKPGRIVKNEQEFMDKEGVLVRMDRVVVDEDKATVIDFKTGKGRDGFDGDRSQVRGYLNVIKEVYPDREVQGIIAYLDQGSVETVTLPVEPEQ